MIYLDLDDLLHIAERTLGGPPGVRDRGLLASAVGRPQARAPGEDAYPTLHEKAAALLHSVARHRALVNGNERLALAVTIAFYGMNGLRLQLTNDQAHELIMRVARGDLDDVPSIAQELEEGTAQGHLA